MHFHWRKNISKSTQIKAFDPTIFKKLLEIKRHILCSFQQLCTLKLFSGAKFIFVIFCFYKRTISLHLFLLLRRRLHIAIYKSLKSFTPTRHLQAVAHFR